MKIKLRSMRSNLDLNPFPGIARRVDSAIRKDCQVYSFNGGENADKVCASERRSSHQVEQVPNISDRDAICC